MEDDMKTSFDDGHGQRPTSESAKIKNHERLMSKLRYILQLSLVFVREDMEVVAYQA